MRHFPRAIGLAALAAFLLAGLAAAQAGIIITGTQGAWTLNNNDANNDVAFPNQTVSYTVANGSNVLIVDLGAFVQTPGASPTGDAYTTSVLWNGTPMIATAPQVTTSTTSVVDEIFYLYSPASGAGTLTISGTDRGIALGAYTLSGVNINATPIVAGSNANTTPIAVALPGTTPANSFIAISEACRETNVVNYTTTATNGTVVQQFTQTDKNPFILVGGAYINNYGGGATTITANNTGDTNGTLRRDITTAVFQQMTLAGTFTWTGATNNSWDTTTANNWTGGPYQDTGTVIFGNNAGSNNNPINIVPTAGVAPSSVTFNNSTTPYSFTGGPITGIVPVTLSASAGSVIFSNSNSIAGNTTINGGTLQLANANALVSSTAILNVNNGLTFASGVTPFNLGGLSGSGNFALADTGGNSINLLVGGNGQTTVFTGNFLASPGSLTKVGGGMLTLSGVNLQTGATTVSGGTLSVAADNALGNTTTAAGVTINPGATFNAAGTFATSRAVTLPGPAAATILTNASQTLTLNTPIAGAGALTKDGAGTLQLGPTGGLSSGAGLNVVNGTLNLGGLPAQTVGAVTFSGASTVANGALAGSSYSFTGAATVSANLQDNAPGSTLTVNANGLLAVLSGSNTYTGLTTITAGTLQIGGGGGSGSLGTTNITNNATLAFSRSDSALTFTQPIGGSGIVVNSGAGTVTLPNANSYTGGTFVNAGALTTGNDAALGTGLLTVAAGGTVNFLSATPSLSGLTGGGSVVLGNSATPASTILAISGTGNSQFSGVISEAATGLGSLSKTGVGTFGLTGTGTYTGGTTIGNGALTAYPQAVGTGKITMNGGNLNVGYGGLYEGWMLGTGNNVNPGGAFSTTTLQSVQSSPRAANWGINQTASGSGVPNTPVNNFPDNTTVWYQGYMYFPQTAGSVVSFYKNFDDSGSLTINGNEIINDASYNNNGLGYPTVATWTIPASGPGWYSFKALFGQGGGGVGPNIAGYTYGLGYDANGSGGTVAANYAFPSAANGTLFETNTASASYTNNVDVLTSGSLAASSPSTYTGTFNLLGGTLSLAGPSTHNMAGVLSGSGGLTVGAGTALTLSGNNNSNFSGVATVNAGGALIVANTAGSAIGTGTATISGTLSGSGIIGGAGFPDVNVLSGGHVAPHASSTGIATLTVASNLDMAAGSVFDFNLQTPAASDLLNVIGNLNIPSTASSETLNIVGLAGFIPGNYELMSISGGTMSGSASSFSLNAPNRYNYSLLTPNDPGSTPGEVILQVSNKQFFWAPATSNIWSTSAPDNSNWTVLLNGSYNATTYTDGIIVNFDDTAGTTNVNIAAAGVQPFSVTLNNNAKPYSFTNSSGTVGIGGAATVILNGTNTVTFNSQNAYTGGTSLNAGTLIVSNDNQLGTAPAAPATNLTFNGGTLSFSNSATLSTNRSIVLNAPGGGTINIPAAANTVSFAGQISGSGSLTTSGAGMLSLSGTNSTYSGGTIITAGTVSSTYQNSLGTGPITLAGGRLNVLGVVAGLSQAYYTGNNYQQTTGWTSKGIAPGPMAGEYARSNATFVATTWGPGTNWAGSWDRTLLASQDTTWTYTGEMYIASTSVSFQGECDDNLQVKLDGNWLGANSGAYGSGIVAVTPGWHAVQFSFFSTNNGGAGSYNTANGFIGQNPDVAPYSMGSGFVVNEPGIGGTAATGASFVPMDPGNGTLFAQGLPATYSNLLNVTAPSTLGVSNGQVTFANLSIGSQLEVSGSSASALTISGSTTLTGPATLNVDAGLSATLAGPVSGNFSVNKAGSGTLTLSSSLSTFTGAVTINGGNLAVTNSASLGNPANGVLINNAALEVATGFTESRSITFNAPGAALQVDAGQTYSNNTVFTVAPGSAVNKTGAGTLLMQSPTLLPYANLTATAGTIDLGNQTHTVAAVAFNGGSITDGSLIGNSYSITAPSSVSATLGGTGGLVVNSTGASTLTGTNTYSGGSTVSQGTLNAAVVSMGSNTITLAGGTFHPIGAAPGLLLNVYTPDAGVANSATSGLLSAWVATLPANQHIVTNALTTANGNTSLSFNPTGNGGYIFTNLGLSNAQQNGGNNYTGILTGYIYLPTGTSTFATRSDDGSMLFIDGATVVTNNAYQGMTTHNGTTISEAAAGYHQIEIEYYQGGGGAGLVAYSDAGNTVLLNSQLSTSIPINNNIFVNNMAVTANSTLDLTNGVAFGFGTLNIGANTLHVTSGPGIANFSSTTLANSPTFDVQGANVLNLGTISGASGLNTTGSGTVIVAGVNSTGPVSVSGGTLVAVAQSYTAPAATGPLGSATITLTNGALDLVNTSTTGTTFDVVSGNPLILAGSNDSIIAGSALAGVAGGAVTLTGSNALPIAAGQTLNLGDVNGYTLTVDPGLVLNNSGTISGGPGSVSLHASSLTPSAGTLSAAQNGTLTLVDPMNTGYYAPAATGTVVLANTYSGSLANLAPLSGGTLVINNNVTNGTLDVANGGYFAGNLSSFGPVTLQLDGGTLGATTALTGANAVANILTWGATHTLNFSGAANLELSGTLGLASGAYNLNDPATRGTLSGVISGSGGLNITGNPTLKGLNTYSGGTTLNAATNVAINNNQAFGTGLLTYNNGGFNATTALVGANAVANPWTITAGQAAYFNGASPYQLSGNAALPAGNDYLHILNTYQGLSVTLSGVISGSAATLIRAGDGNANGNSINGTVVINNPLNTFSAFTLQTQGGNIDVGGASTVLNGSGGIASGPLGIGTVTIGDTNYNGCLGLLNSSPVAATLANPVIVYEAAAYWSASGLTLSGPMTLAGRGNNVGNNVYNGVINFYLGANQSANAGNNTFTNSNVTFSGIISGGSASGINLATGSGTGGLTLSG
ncbi:MAG: autotransporter-associated beta strand repeat-containing protein, partial [Thermoguttaceae bacterium]